MEIDGFLRLQVFTADYGSAHTILNQHRSFKEISRTSSTTARVNTRTTGTV